jgi:hypothetical protein
MYTNRLMRIQLRRSPSQGTISSSAPPMGGGYSTVDDLARFADALLGNRILNREMTALVLTGYIDAEYGGRDGFRSGFARVSPQTGRRLAWVTRSAAKLRTRFRLHSPIARRAPDRRPNPRRYECGMATSVAGHRRARRGQSSNPFPRSPAKAAAPRRSPSSSTLRRT